MYEHRHFDYQMADAERAYKRSRLSQPSLGCSIEGAFSGSARSYADTYQAAWGQDKLQKAAQAEARNVIALSAIAGGQIAPMHAAYVAQPCSSIGVPTSTTTMTPSMLPAYYQPHPAQPCLPPQTYPYLCQGPEAVQLHPQLLDPVLDTVGLKADTAPSFSSHRGFVMPDAQHVQALPHDNMSSAQRTRMPSQPTTKKEDAFNNEVKLRMIITQAQANFLVRKDGGTVRLQQIRNQMKNLGAACEIKLYDDKGQNSDDHCLEIRSSCEGQPRACPAHTCLMAIADLLLQQTKASTIRLAIPEGDQPGKLLGTKGACIASIRKLSRANIKLAQDLSEIIGSGGCIEGVVEGDRLLTISGPPETIPLAVSDCIAKLLESQQGDGTRTAHLPQAHSNPSSPNIKASCTSRRGRSLSPTLPSKHSTSPQLPRPHAQKRPREGEQTGPCVDLWITKQQKEVLMGPKGAAVKAIQQVRNGHTQCFIKLHDDGATADQKRRLEIRGPSRHHVEAVKYDIDQQLRAAGHSELPDLHWEQASNTAHSQQE